MFREIDQSYGDDLLQSIEPLTNSLSVWRKKAGVREEAKNNQPLAKKKSIFDKALTNIKSLGK